MLQQTQINTVISYYEILGSYSDPATLARAPLPRVLRRWSGLGYYRRAENLKKAARQIVARHGGKLPRDFINSEPCPVSATIPPERCSASH